ncbi:polyphosphate kinase 2 [Magnetococcales bacterium HHB-1]
MNAPLPETQKPPESLSLEELRECYQDLLKENAELKKDRTEAVRRFRADKQLRPYAAELIKLQRYLEDEKRRMVILFEGRDAAGKGGAIRRVTRFLNPKHYRIVVLGKPTEVQKTQWFFQKYVAQLPRGGEMVLFDRSWYNRAMVEPVFNFCSPEQYQLFMRGVGGFEKDMVRQGTILIKIYFSVSKEEQARRFEVRKTNPLEQWKLSEVDLQAQDHWEDFTRMKFEMLRRTHTPMCPWTIIRADDKPEARINAMRIILNSVNYSNRNPDLNYVPNPEVVISGSREYEDMLSTRVRNGEHTDNNSLE